MNPYGIGLEIEMNQTHVQHRLSGARGNNGGGGPGNNGGGGSEDEDDAWDDARSIAGSILSHSGESRWGDFVPDEISSVASDILADRYYSIEDEDVMEMLDWYEDNFDDRGHPIYCDDDDNEESCLYCENIAALDCSYDECGSCCDANDCVRHY